MTINQKLSGRKDTLHKREFIKQIAYDENIVFSIAAAKDNTTFFDLKYGSYTLLGKEEKKDVSEETRFNVGSVTKTVTAALTVKLCEEKKLALDDPVEKYLPRYRYGDVKIINLLTHTAGYAGKRVGWPKDTSETDKYLKEIYAADKEEKAGEKREYTTFLYSFLMEIIQNVSDMDLHSYAHKTLFSKLGMEKTTYCPGNLDIGNIAFPFDCKTGKYDCELYDAPPTGDTGLYTTAGDLLKFAGLFCGEKEADGQGIFSGESIELMKNEVKGQFDQTPVFWYKGATDKYLCFPDISSSETLAHPGYTGCIICIDPRSKISYAILTNNKTYHEDFTNYKRTGNLIMNIAMEL